MELRRLRFSKDRRLVSNEQFLAVLSARACAADGLLTVYAVRNGLPYSRLGVSVGKYCGPAVARNHLKRLIREAFRVNQNAVPGPMDYLVMPSKRRFKGISRRQVGRRITTLRLGPVQTSFLSLVSAAASKADNNSRRTSP